MKKPIAFPRLVLKRETLRALDNMRLEEVRGGSDAAPIMDSGAGDTCPALGAIARQQIGG